MAEIQDIEGIAMLLRRDVIEMTTTAGSGHPSSCLSAAEIVASLFFDVMKYDIHNPENPDNDEFVLSKGHAAPILYSALKRAGAIKTELLRLRKPDSPLEGHPMPRSIHWAKAATGSLGQGLSVGLGMAISAKLQHRKYKTYVLLGDGECAEGQVWEAAEIASHYKLDNLVAVVDVNGLGQRGETLEDHHMNGFGKIFSSLGWEVSLVKGHDVRQLLQALRKQTDKPHAILAYTIKGKGVSFIEGKNGWHGRALTQEEMHLALAELKIPRIGTVRISHPEITHHEFAKSRTPPAAEYSRAMQYSTREAYGNALAKIVCKNPYALVLDGEVSNSTYSITAKKASPFQFIEMYIAEQNMISASLGLAKKGHRVFTSTFAAFLSRAHDQLRMAALSDASFVVCGSHAGCSIGEDGPSQMGLEDITMFRSLPNSTIFCPADAISAEKLTELAAKNHKGINYIRTTRPKLPLLYSGKAKFEIGKFSILHEGKKDRVVLAGSGITVVEAIKASEILAEKGINAAVIDIYCVKPFNEEVFRNFVSKHGNRLVIAEDHYPEGGIGEMLSSALAGTNTKIERLAVKSVPRSATAREQLAMQHIDHTAIVEAVRKILKK